MTAPTGPSRSRRERPAKPALTRPAIVAAAAEIMRTEGLAKVTMRRLAQELDTGPASLYVYVANTAELHAALLDELLGTVPPPAATGDWRVRLRAVLTSYTETLFAHPGLARSALAARPSGPHYLRLIETLLGLLDEGGVPRARAAWGVDVLTQYATATAAEQATRDRSPDAGAEWDALAGAVREASERSHPHLAGAGDHLLSGSPNERLAWGFDVLINGILHTPTPEAASTDTGEPA